MLNHINIPEFNSIINIDKLTYAANTNNIKVNDNINYIFYKIDIGDTSAVTEILKRHNVNYIINFAAETHVDNSILNPNVFIKTNVLGTANLLTCAKQYWQNDYKNKKFIQISTDEVYGSLSEESSSKFTESSPLEPHSPYSASKTSADLIALSYYYTYKFPVLITRCSNNYGPNQHKEKLIPLIIFNALNDFPIPIYGDGMNVRDWINVRDYCDAILNVLLNGRVGEVYNVGANTEKTNIEIANTILDYLNKPKALIQYVEDRLGHDRHYGVDASKIINELGWQQTIPFEVGIINTIEYYKNIFNLN